MPARRKVLGLLAIASLVLGLTAAAPAASAPLYDVTVVVLDRNGHPATADDGSISIQGDDIYESLAPGGSIRLPAGRYFVDIGVETDRPGKAEPSITHLVQPKLQVGANTTIVYDARVAKRVRFDVDRPDARVTRLGVVWEAPRNGESFELDGTWDELYVGGVGPAASDFRYYLRAQLMATDAKLEVVRPTSLNLDVWWYFGQPRLVGKARLQLADAGAGRPADIQRLDVRGKAVVVKATDTTDLAATLTAIARGGGRLTVLILRPGELLSDPDHPIMPTLFTTRAEGASLVALAKQGGTVDVEGMRNSPYRYDIATSSSGQVPTRPGGRFRDSDLGRTHVRYVNASAPDATGFVYDELEGFGFPNGANGAEMVRLPLERTEYSTPGVWRDRYSWEVPSHPSQAGSGGDSVRVVKRGSNPSVTRGAPVIGPGFAGPFDKEERGSWASREGTEVDVVVPLLTDGTGHIDDPDLDQSLPGDRGSTKLFRNGRLVRSIPLAGKGGFQIPPGPALLRIETEFARDATWWPTSTRVKASWSLASKRDGVLPLLVVRYHPDIDLRGKVAGGRAYELPLTVEQEAGVPRSRIATLAVEASYDDGRTWSRAPVTKHGSGWRAHLVHPTTGFVSLRARAADAQGTRVEQTITRAYQLK